MGSSVHGISQARILEWVAISLSRESSQSESESEVGQLCLFATPWTVALQAPLSMDSAGNSSGVGCHFLLQGIFPAQELNPHLLLGRQILYR